MFSNTCERRIRPYQDLTELKNGQPLRHALACRWQSTRL
jgi:hypothetical protein